MSKHADIDAYIAALPEERKALAQEIRATILKAAPDAEQVISYAIPCFIVAPKRRLYFAVWKAHVGLYPIHDLPAALEARVAPYRATPDTLQFKYTEPMPFDLIGDLARHIASLSAN
jgi:uncharacterized protein YdhG (YjbR/CyaY superfamily)